MLFHLLIIRKINEYLSRSFKYFRCLHRVNSSLKGTYNRGQGHDNLVVFRNSIFFKLKKNQNKYRKKIKTTFIPYFADNIENSIN